MSKGLGAKFLSFLAANLIYLGIFIPSRETSWGNRHLVVHGQLIGVTYIFIPPHALRELACVALTTRFLAKAAMVSG